MKRLLFMVVVLAALVACNNEDVVEKSQKAPIDFGSNFVDNISRADFSSGRIVDEFKVYGVVTNKETAHSEQIFNAVTVTNPSTTSNYHDEVWSYEGAQHWAPNANYEFVAIVDGEAAVTTSLPQAIPFTVVDGEGNKDLLYATAIASTNADATPIEGNAGNVLAGVVQFSFEHLLSKLQVTVKNGFGPIYNYSYEVVGVTVSGVAEKGVYAVEDGVWAQEGSSTIVLTLGGAEGYIAGEESVVTAESRQILPVNQELTFAVTYNKKIHDSVVESNKTLTGTLDARDFHGNIRYNITATILDDKLELATNTMGCWANPEGVR